MTEPLRASLWITAAGDGAEPTVEPAVEPAYRSPYRLRFRTSSEARQAGFGDPPWNSPDDQAVVAPTDWYTAETAQRWGSWGPRARAYPAPAERYTGPLARERLLAVAGALIGLDYQHHHVPAWDPPAGWPWKDVRSGRRGPGLDCSNFVSFVYSYALGITLPTAVGEQSELHRTGPLLGPQHHRVSVVSGDYDTLTAQLLPGDILYLRSDRGTISHCVLWLGGVGETIGAGEGPNTTPLVIDCASDPRLDAHRVPIPAGVRIRPYRRTGWYARATSHAHRIITD
ncbi:NlpC/P60 family protein [Herbiconiux solani]|uniref:NlpC/P60 family protein n=1 Tax=Herbiconiux solani TaxID=661329 RepID=UPI000AA6F92F|nr:NlpC/P60 family protein [Herbiconiux solani]